MNVSSIICEFNPLHNGHYQLIQREIKKNKPTYIVAIMSGNMTQRGEFPLFDKWTRGEMAIKAGVDLVIELPLVYTLNSADYFGYGGVSLIDKLGIVDNIFCGSEYPEDDFLEKFYNIYSSPDFESCLKEYLNKGLSYPQSISNSFLSFKEDLKMDEEILKDILKSPNFLLAFSYYKASKLNEKSLTFHLHKRIVANHNDDNLYEEFASGSAIRKIIFSNKLDESQIKNVVPDFTLSQLNKKDNIYPKEDWLFHSLFHKLVTVSKSELEHIYGMEEGLADKILNTFHNSSNLEEFIFNLKSKRYTFARIKRLIFYILFNLTKMDMEDFLQNGVKYIRVIAFNEKGKYLLKQIKNKREVPIITKTTHFLNSKNLNDYKSLSTLEKMLYYDILATRFFYMAKSEYFNINKDFTKSPLYFSDIK